MPSSYIVEGLLKNKKLLSDDQIVAPELVVYEVTNAIWKHENLLKDLENGKPYLSIFYGLIEDPIPSQNEIESRSTTPFLSPWQSSSAWL